MATTHRYIVDLNAEELAFLEELVSAHGWRADLFGELSDQTYLALRSARPSLTIVHPYED